MKPALKLFLLFTVFATSHAMAADPATSQPSPTTHPAPTSAVLLDKAQELFYKNDHDGALSYLQKYFSSLSKMEKPKLKARLRFFAIGTMGRIYLQFKRDPAAAIAWFEKQQKSSDLSDAEQDIISGWIEAAKDWQKLGKFPSDTSSEAELFELGKKYYESGLKKQKAVMDQRGAADFSIAASYLVPFLVHYDSSPHVGEALFMMGDLRRRLWTTNQFWSENFYLSETIRRFPGTPIAVKAYNALKEDVHFGYTGSSGDQTPQSWLDLLDVLKKLAHEKPKQKNDKTDLKPAN